MSRILVFIALLNIRSRCLLRLRVPVIDVFMLVCSLYQTSSTTGREFGEELDSRTIKHPSENRLIVRIGCSIGKTTSPWTWIRLNKFLGRKINERQISTDLLSLFKKVKRRTKSHENRGVETPPWKSRSQAHQRTIWEILQFSDRELLVRKKCLRVRDWISRKVAVFHVQGI